jgi:hypothetical protein
MAILVIDTQFMENYGAHDWDGEGACPQYWKMKGGSSYKVAVEFDKDYEWAEVYVDRILSKVRSELEWADDYSQQYILGWHLEDDDWMSWFEKSQLEYEGKVAYPEPMLEVAA